jgi:diaminohydroxyphosphoribosylaminopyrimidine deaminase / 5-amino-6-(5-phosphoribosylamino)uracil reductase
MSEQDDERWMSLAVELAWLCPPSDAAYSVGAVIVAADGAELSRGFSREGDPHVHAEESALSKLTPDDARLRGAAIYSTLEPCSRRKSRPRTCTQLIIASGLARVVIAWREPSLFVADCQGAELLEQAGLTVVELPGFAERAAAPNRHLALLAERIVAPVPGRPVLGGDSTTRRESSVRHWPLPNDWVSSTATGR